MASRDGYLKLVAAVVFLALAAYAGAAFLKKSDFSESTCTATYDTVSLSQSAEALVLHNETELELPSDAYVLVSTGQRISGGDIIAAGDGDALAHAMEYADLKAELDCAEKTIILKNSLSATGDEQALKNSVAQLLSAMEKNDFALRNARLELIDGILRGDGTGLFMHIKKLRVMLIAQRQKLENDNIIFAPCSGYFAAADGCEGISPDCVSGLSEDEFHRLMKKASSGGGKYKILSASDWYCAAETDSSPLFEAGTQLTAQFSDGEKIPCEIYSITELSGGKALLLLRFRSDAEYSLGKRCEKITLCLSELGGLRLPASAVKEDENGQYVYILNSDAAKEKCAVKIIYEESGYCLVSSENTLLREGISVLKR